MDLKRKIVQRIEEMKRERYKTMFVVGNPLSGKTTIAKDVTNFLDAEYVDHLQDVLTKIKSPVIGAYSPIDFRDYLKKKGNSSPKVVLIDEVKWLISTWSQKQRKELPRLLSFLATKSVVILVVTKPCEWVNNISSTSQGESRILDIDQYGERYG